MQEMYLGEKELWLMNTDKKMKKIEDKYILGVLILYTGIIVLISFSRIFDNAFWGDECYSIGLVKMGFMEMIQETGADVHPPLYYILLRVISSMLGQKGHVFHLVSVIPVGLTLFFAVSKVYKKFGACVAFLLVTFVFFLDTAILFSVEVRMYSWANFFVLMSFYEMHEIMMFNKKKNWILFSIFSLAAAYTHYYALVAVAFLYVMLIIYEVWKKGQTWKKTLAVCVAAVVVYLPWLINLLQAFERTANSWWVEEIPKIRYCIEYLFASKMSLLYVGIWGVGIVILFYNTYVKKKENFEFTFWILSGLISIVGTIGVGELVSILWRPMFQTRYVYVVAGIAWLTFGVAIEKLKGNTIWLIGILAITFVIGIPNYFSWVENDKEYQAGTQLILDSTKDMKDTEVLWTNSPHLDWTMLEYYYPDNEYLLIEDSMDGADYSDADWLFWENELENMAEYKVAEGYMGPYNYIYVYKIGK